VRSGGPERTGGPGRSRLVVLRALGLGDLLTSVPALRALARAFPAHERLLVAPQALAPLVALVDAGGEPAVHGLVAHRGLPPLPAAAHGADVAVNLHGRGPQSHRVLRAAAPDRLVGFRHPDAHPDPEAPAWRPGEHEVDRWCRMLAGHGIPADPGDLHLGAPVLPAGLAWTAGATMIHPGAASISRRWPASRWAQVARAERAEGRAVVVTGGPDERGLAQDVAELAGLGEDAVLAGRTGLHDLAAVVGAAARVASGDTGVSHLATAFGTPSVTLFGPVPPAEWGPPAPPRAHGPRAERHVALRAARPGERGDPHAGVPDPALLRLEARDVLAALARLPEPAALSSA
jgi:ADP-heptose:LPS heptosyltransferase